MWRDVLPSGTISKDFNTSIVAFFASTRVDFQIVHDHFTSQLFLASGDISSLLTLSSPFLVVMWIKGCTCPVCQQEKLHFIVDSEDKSIQILTHVLKTLTSTLRLSVDFIGITELTGLSWISIYTSAICVHHRGRQQGVCMCLPTRCCSPMLSDLLRPF